MSGQGGNYAVVMRMAGMWPRDIGGYEIHRTRAAGDLGQVDSTRTGLNQRLHGTPTWAQEVYDEIVEMRLENHANELERLRKRRRTTELERRMAEGPRDPWRVTRHGPLREVILTANAKWFDDDLTQFFGLSGPTREQQFEALAIAWLKKEFGDDFVHARADRDESAYHVHAVIVPRSRLADGRRMLQPAKHPVIRDYEHGQDSIGAWFEAAQIGLVRGERRAQELREALEHNTKIRKEQAEAAPGARVGTLVEVPRRRRHVTPRAWREKQERLLARREKAAGAREARNDERDQELDCRASALGEREITADRKAQDADAALEIARDVAQGKIELAELSENEAVTPPAPPEDGPNRANLAKRLFGRALSALRTKAAEEARTELSEAFAEIRAADDAIVEVARKLPESAREVVANARRSLTARIMILSKTAKKWVGLERQEPRDR